MTAQLARIALVALMLTACTSEPESPEDQIRALLTRAEKALAERDLDTLREAVSESYADASGRNKRELVQLITLHTLRGGRLFALTRLQELELAPDGAHASVLAALARAPIHDFRSLRDASADAWVFELVFVEESAALWRLIRAAWRPALVDDFR